MTSLSEHLARLGKKGGQARAHNLTEKQRKESARNAAQARWAKEKAELKDLIGEITEGTKKLEARARKRAPKERKEAARTKDKPA